MFITVKDLESLESLDMSENGLEEIDCRLMTSLPHLLTLNLRGNRFTDLRYASVACCSPTLMRLDLNSAVDARSSSNLLTRPNLSENRRVRAVL